MANTKYCVTGNWSDKSSGEALSGIAKVNEGVNKLGQPYAFLDTESRETPIKGTYPVGTILEADISFSVQKVPNPASKSN